MKLEGDDSRAFQPMERMREGKEELIVRERERESLVHTQVEDALTCRENVKDFVIKFVKH
jgi:hypothetical protein